jgi:hypothetical protein
MSYNGSGTFNINTAGQPVVTGTTITSTAFNLLTADLATGLTTALTKDGQTTPTANIPMGGFKVTGLGAGSAATDAAQYGQLQAGATTIATVSGTDTLTGSLSPAPSAYATGNLFSFVAANTNTGATTINLNSLGAKSITKAGSTALAAGDLVSGQIYLIEYDGTRFQLLNAPPVALGVSSITFGSTGLTPSTATSGAVTVAGTLAVANGGTNSTATPTAGGVGYGTGTAHAYSAVGTSGQVLTSAGAGAPTWTTPNASGLVYLSTVTASGASTVDVETGFSSTYDNYMVVIDNFANSAASTGNIRFKTGGAYDTGSTYFLVAGASGSTTTRTSGVFNAYTDPSSNGGFIVNIIGANSGAGKICTSNGSGFNSGTAGINGTAGYSNGWNNSGAVQGIRFYQGSGTISGTFTLYGIAKA